MDQRLLDYYNRELSYLRELGGEFARQFPKIAGRLGLDAFECADPYVERLLEGFAFLAARVKLKIDAEFPRFTGHMLEMVYPHYLAPTPSMAVVQMLPNHRQGVLTDGFVVPAGTVLRGNLGKGEPTACEYRTGHALELWPIEVVSVTHSTYLGDIGDVRPATKRPLKAALRIKLRTVGELPFQQLSLTTLPLFVRGQDQVALRLYELLLSASVALVVRPPQAAWSETVDEHPVTPIGFSDDEALLPYGPRSFQGYRLLHEYFALPSRYQFVDLRGLGPAVKRCTGQELDVIVLLDRHDPVVEGAVSPAHLAPFCTPAINLFPRRADRIHLSDRTHEYHVVADRTRPMDLEVHTVTEVIGYGTSADIRREFLPFYACDERTTFADEPAFYTVRREPRVASTRQRRDGSRSTYGGSELFLSLVDGREGPYHSDLRQLSVNTLCTNRDLPLEITLGEGRTDFHLETGAPVEAVRCVAGPSAPHASHAWGDVAWRLIGHLSLNYLSLADSSEGQGAAALRELLHLYGDLADPGIRRQIDGVRSIKSSPIVRRVPTDGPACFGRGLEVTVSCDESAFEGTSVFLLGSVLERFFAKYVSINSFTETVLRTTQRGEIMRWPAEPGRRPIL
jgi:type VI secretion system protein ImpG